MSLRSMTGYGRGVAAGKGLHVEVEVSSVNRKQLDVNLNLPGPLRMLESRIQDEIAKSLSRGRVIVEVAVRGSERLKREAIRVNEDLARAYVQELRKTAKRLQITDDLHISRLMNLPGVLHYEPLDDDIEKVWPVLSKALTKALQEILRMRLREGTALQKDLEHRLSILRGIVKKIMVMSPHTARKYRDALKARLAQAGLNVPLEDERVLKEVVLFADRSDVTEETTRLDSHFKQARELLRSKEPAGRALDFLSQEMNREINTIGSKANDKDIAALVVSFKAELERMREQVQNIE
jgi:uncharacterized protein (TIGR00255 family)